MFSFFRKRKFLTALLILIFTGFLLPGEAVIPVDGAGTNSWNHESFWYYPWGKSVVHKGIDIFAAEGTPVLASVYGIVLYAGTIERGGNVVIVLGPKWRIHYYAHLKTSCVHFLSLVGTGGKIGEVGTSGNAAGKPPHLHYSIATIFPYLWRIDLSH